MKKAIVNGAMGMIGRALVEYLMNQDIEVLALVREKLYSEKDFPKGENLKILECNLDKIKNLNLNDTYDTFFHFAWVGTFGDERDNVFTQMKNIEYTLDSLELAKRSGCKTFIGAGSQAEYGRIEGIITPSSATNPENSYGIAKLAAGQISKVLANKYNIKHIWTRILSVYGPYDNPKTMVMSSIIKMINEHNSPEYTKGEQIWDYIYSRDVAKAFYLLAEKGKNNSTYCVASGISMPLYEYIRVIRNQIDPTINLKIGAIKYSKKQVMNLQADISNLKNDTGFYPDYSFEEGIKETIKWYKESSDKNEKN